MSREEVTKTDYWKERITKAHSAHHSVYLASDVLWEYIWNAHKEIMRVNLKSKDKILDAGCGYGRLAPFFENYTGVDFSPDFIEWAKREHPDKTFLQADLKALPFKDKEFDWAICISIRHMIIGYVNSEEWGKMETELRRVAKKILILEYSEPEKYEILK